MIGVNLWGLIPTAQEDLPSVLRELKQIGFDSVESMLVPKKHDAYAKGTVSAECTKASVIRTIRTLSREYGVESFVFSGAFTDA